MKRIIFAALLGTIGLSACDDGPIEEKTFSEEGGRVVKFEATLTGLEHWPQEFSVALAGFDASDDYAVIMKYLPTTDGQVTMTMGGIPDNVTSLQLCVIDRLRRHVMTFHDTALGNSSDTIRIDAGNVDVSMFNAIQVGYLTPTCSSCHDGSSKAVAGLHLNAGDSYASMVAVASSRVPGINIVEPGSPRNSLLHRVLSEESVDGIHMRHYDLDVKTKDKILPLIDAWISNGAREN